MLIEASIITACRFNISYGKLPRMAKQYNSKRCLKASTANYKIEAFKLASS
ncbi:hypothetical protein HMPREF9554_01086 [Treponema phagedenis F0421]|nr:hypothetical protein HMPREF9554_01086 [Treponema phagedenis F0421]